MRKTCKVCNHVLIEPWGDPKSKWLIVGDAPGWEDLREGRPFVGRAGDILGTELGRHGYMLSNFRLTTMWLHSKDEKNCNVQWHIDQMAKEMKGRTHVLLMGSDPVLGLFGKKSHYLSATKVKSAHFPKTSIWVSPNILTVLNSPIGEVRLAIERFCQSLK